MRYHLFLVVLITLAVFNWSSFAQPQISVSPTALEFELLEGQIATDTIEISNPGTDTLEIRLREELPEARQVPNILAWIRYADLDQEWAHTVAAMNMYLTPYILDTTYTEDPNILTQLLVGKTAFLIPEPENAPVLFNLGTAWAGVLNNFVSNGGLVLALDHANDAAPLINGSGLINIQYYAYYNPTQQVQIMDMSHPFAQGMPQFFNVEDGWNKHQSSNGVCFVQVTGYNNLTYRYLGAGMAVYWGVDFFEYNNNMAFLLCNMLSWEGGLGWLDSHPMFAQVPPGGMQEVEVSVNSTYLVPDIYQALLVVENNAGDSTEIPVNITLTVNPNPPPEIVVNPDSFVIELPMSTKLQETMTISNIGAGGLAYNASFSPETTLTRVDRGEINWFLPKTPTITASEKSRQSPKLSSPPASENNYTGQYLMFGITNSYGEIMPFQCPVGVEHLMNGGYYCGYTLSYLVSGIENTFYSEFDDRYGINVGTYEELIISPTMVKVRTTNTTQDNRVSYEQVFTSLMDNKFILVEATIRNISSELLSGLYYKISADWDVDGDWEDDSWNYDASRNMAYAYEVHYCTITPATPQPAIIDLDGWDDYGRRITDGNCPPGFYTMFDGLELLHYNCGDLSPWSEVKVSVIFASGNDLTDLQAVVDAGIALIQQGVWLSLKHPSGHIDPGLADTLGVLFCTAGLAPDTYLGNILIESNDPITPEIEIPVSLTVTPIVITVDAEPLVSPVQIPSIGGSFEYTLSLYNPQSYTVYVDVWNGTIAPDSTELGSSFVMAWLELPALSTIDTTLTQVVNGYLPAGDYYYYINAGINENNTVCGTDGFIVTKLPAVDSGSEGNVANSPPTVFSFSFAHPNPFNAQTSFKFDLPAAMEVSLKVYDIQGRVVATVADGWYSAGSYQVRFIGNELSSGIYFAQIKAGDYHRTDKLLLVK